MTRVSSVSMKRWMNKTSTSSSKKRLIIFQIFLFDNQCMSIQYIIFFEFIIQRENFVLFPLFCLTNTKHKEMFCKSFMSFNNLWDNCRYHDQWNEFNKLKIDEKHEKFVFMAFYEEKPLNSFIDKIPCNVEVGYEKRIIKKFSLVLLLESFSDCIFIVQ